MALLRGTLENSNLTSIRVINESSTRTETREMAGLAHGGQFKALADLVPGQNQLRLEAGDDQIVFTLNYLPQTNVRIVRPVLYTLNNGDTRYPTPLANDPQDYAAKLGTMMKIMQTFTAESMHDQGYPRLTFNLPINPETGEVEVFTLTSAHDADFYYNLSYDRSQLWYEAVDLIPRQIPDSLAKNVVIVGFTSYDPGLDYKYAHTALGGGDVGLMGGLSLWAAPSSVNEIQATYMDGTTAYPNVQGEGDFVYETANTVIGAALHELGHAMGRPHEGDFDLSIMQRGFDRMYRMFTLTEPGGSTWNPGRVGNWSETSAAAFAANHPYFHYPPPVADIVDIDPDPLSDAAHLLGIRFDQPVSGLQVSDFSLQYNGSELTEFGTVASVTQIAPNVYELNTGDLTDPEGDYTLTLHAQLSEVVNGAGLALMDDQIESWTRSPDGPPILDRLAALDISDASAILSARLASGGGRETWVWLAWGGYDAGSNLADWPQSVPLGKRLRGQLSHELADLNPESRVTFRALATNELGVTWSEPFTFSTRERLLLVADSTAAWQVPFSSAEDNSWYLPGYDDSSWNLGQGGFGYETSGSDYRPLLATDVGPQMSGSATSLRLRFPFAVRQPEAIRAASLRVKYDDGFVAFLNGVEVARANAPFGQPAWNASATDTHGDDEAVVYQHFDLAGSAGLFESSNVLAIQALNESSSSSDLLMVIELTVSTAAPTNLVSAGDAVRAWVPFDNALGLDWIEPDFADENWLAGTTGVGYELSQGYESLLGLDMLGSMYAFNTTVYMRIPFNVEEPSVLTGLRLRMKYDDAFVAYLNGVEIARSANAPEVVSWNSAAVSIHDDADAVIFEDYDASQHLLSLLPGQNILAVHGMNDSFTSSDLLLLPELVASIPAPPLGPETFAEWIARFDLADQTLTGDPDGDLVTNENEWVMGSHPGVGDAHLFSTKMLRTLTGIVFLRFRTVAGRTYQIYYSPDPAHWQEAGPPYLAREDEEFHVWVDNGEVTDPPPSQVGSRFYKVEVSLTSPP